MGANSFDSKIIDYISKTKYADVVMLDYKITKQSRESQIKSFIEQVLELLQDEILQKKFFE